MPRQIPSRPTLGPSAFLDQATAKRQAKGTPARRAPGQAAASFFARYVDSREPLRLALRDGSDLVGVLEWQDRAALRVNLADGSHRIVPKTALAYVERLPAEPAPEQP